jgi:ABC-type uncharacterized transport system auxiliary subunit
MKTACFRQSILPGMASLILSACGGLLSNDKPAGKTFWLDPADLQEIRVTNGFGGNLALRFTVVPGLDSDQLVTLDPDARLNHLSSAHWPDHLPEFGASLVQRSLQATGRYGRVSRDRATLAGDCRLELEAQAFFTLIDRAGKPGSIDIGLAGSYQCGERTIPLMLHANTAVSGQGLAAVVAAYQRAFNEVMRDLRDLIESFESS